MFLEGATCEPTEQARRDDQANKDQKKVHFRRFLLILPYLIFFFYHFKYYALIVILILMHVL
ncbi:hypothetical protein KFK09_008409 [Dendrobium nobile]|uniref:Uncharacterized protein n=1 Tax=Dendrobium nobile TaxID=94219 RepID=A0A8T3BNN3_DENNO|nr:hypothetical protein KFK09_008409 [Dendrobium nobile]